LLANFVLHVLLVTRSEIGVLFVGSWLPSS